MFALSLDDARHPHVDRLQQCRIVYSRIGREGNAIPVPTVAARIVLLG